MRPFAFFEFGGVVFEVVGGFEVHGVDRSPEHRFAFRGDRRGRGDGDRRYGVECRFVGDVQKRGFRARERVVEVSLFLQRFGDRIDVFFVFRV